MPLCLIIKRELNLIIIAFLLSDVQPVTEQPQVLQPDLHPPQEDHHHDDHNGHDHFHGHGHSHGHGGHGHSHEHGHHHLRLSFGNPSGNPSVAPAEQPQQVPDPIVENVEQVSPETADDEQPEAANNLQPDVDKVQETVDPYIHQEAIELNEPAAVQEPIPPAVDHVPESIEQLQSVADQVQDSLEQLQPIVDQVPDSLEQLQPVVEELTNPEQPVTVDPTVDSFSSTVEPFVDDVKGPEIADPNLVDSVSQVGENFDFSHELVDNQPVENFSDTTDLPLVDEDITKSGDKFGVVDETVQHYIESSKDFVSRLIISFQIVLIFGVRKQFSPFSL